MAATTNVTMTVYQNGQILIPIELNNKLFLQNNDWLQVKVTADYMVLIPSRVVEAEIIEELIHEGVLINAE